MELRRLEDIHFDKYVISIDQTEYGSVLAITCDDSSITFYDPKTMAVFNGSDDNTTVTCLAQAGFYSPPEISGASHNPNPHGFLLNGIRSTHQFLSQCLRGCYAGQRGTNAATAHGAFLWSRK